MKEYEVYVPVSYNDGSPIESEKLDHIRTRLLNQFGSLTFLPSQNEGFWSLGEIVYQDRIVLFRVITAKVRQARRFFRQFKEDLKRDLQQEEIFIVEKDAHVL